MKKFFLLLKILTSFLIGLTAYVYLFNMAVVVQGESMEPFLRSGDKGFSERVWFFTPEKEYERNDLVVVRDERGFFVIKRIIGLPNETIRYSENGLYINDVLIRDDYANGETLSRDTGELEEGIDLNEGEFFVMGDNRENSRDSRRDGPIHESQIRGYAFKTIDEINLFLRPIFWLMQGGLIGK